VLDSQQTHVVAANSMNAMFGDVVISGKLPGMILDPKDRASSTHYLLGWNP